MDQSVNYHTARTSNEYSREPQAGAAQRPGPGSASQSADPGHGRARVRDLRVREHAGANDRANHIGVGNGTVYRYFPTKEKLFLAAVERGLKELEAEMDAVLAQQLDGAELMRLAVRTYLGFFHRRPEMVELFIQERAAFPHHHRPLYFVTKGDETECKHQEFFARLVESGVIRPIPHERFFSVIGDLLYGTILTNLLTSRPNDPDAQAADVLDVILNGLLAPKGEMR
jgi:AcrR family transcriptional regulator